MVYRPPLEEVVSQTDTTLAHLEALFLEVRRAVMRAGAGSGVEVKFNAKGDRVRSFDTAAHEAACAYLGDRFPWPVVQVYPWNTRCI